MPIGYRDRTDQFGRIIDTATERARQDTALAEEGISRGLIGSIQAVGQIPANILSGYQKGRQFAEESGERQAKIQAASTQAKVGEAELAAQQETANIAKMPYSSKATPGEKLTVGQARVINPLRVSEENAASLQQMRETQANAAEGRATLEQEKLRLQQLLAANKPEKGVMDEKTANQGFVTMAEHIKGSVRDVIGAEKRRATTAAHALSMMHGDLSKMTPEQVNEVAAAFAAQVSQGSPAESTIKSMTPSNMPKKLSQLYSQMTGNPEPANQEEYMSMFRDMFKRQTDTSRGIIKSEMAPIIAAHEHLRRYNPEKFNAILKSAGVSTDEGGNIVAYEPEYLKSRETPMPGQQGVGEAYAAPIAPDVMDYAKKHGVSYEEAMAIKDMRGGK